MLSIPDMAILGAAALMFFGPEQLPKVARKVGLFVRDVQNTSQTFIREMERAADEPEPGAAVSRAHLLDEHETPAAPTTSAYGAYDGGFVASNGAADVPRDEFVPPPAPHVPPPRVTEHDVAEPFEHPLPGHQPAP